jgi:hypothetical protein
MTYYLHDVTKIIQYDNVEDTNFVVLQDQNLLPNEVEDNSIMRFMTAQVWMSEWLQAQQDMPPKWIFCSFVNNSELYPKDDVDSVLSDQSSCCSDEIICTEDDNDSYVGLMCNKSKMPLNMYIGSQTLPKNHLALQVCKDVVCDSSSGSIMVTSKETTLDTTDDATTIASGSCTSSASYRQTCVVRSKSTIEAATSDWTTSDSHQDQYPVKRLVDQNDVLGMAVTRNYPKEIKWYHPSKICRYFTVKSKNVALEIRQKVYGSSTCSCTDISDENRSQEQHQQECDQEQRHDFHCIQKGFNHKIHSIMSSLPPRHPLLRRRQKSFDSLTYSWQSSDESCQHWIID